MAEVQHADLTSIHRFAYVQSSDPGAVGAYKGWLDTTTNPPVLKYRNAGDSAWVTALDITTAVNAVVNSAPGALDTLDELAAALGDDANFATTVTNALALKAPLANPTFTGTVAGITAAMVSAAPATPSVNAQTGTTYTLQASDNGKIVTCDNAAGCTVTVPSGLGAGFHCQVIQLDEEVDFDTSGATLNNRQGHTKIAGQFGVATIEAYASNVFVLAGDTAA